MSLSRSAYIAGHMDEAATFAEDERRSMSHEAQVTLLRSLSRSAAFGVGFYAPRLIALILLPVYARYLQPADFALVAMVDMLTGLFAAIVNAGFSNATLRFHADAKDRSEENAVLITAFSAALGFGAVIAAALFVAALVVERVASLPTLLQALWRWAPALLLVAVFDSGLSTIEATFRARMQAAGFLALAMCRSGAAALLGLYLVLGAGLGVGGYVWGVFAASASALVLFGGWACWSGWTRPRLSLGRELLQFATPYLPLALFEFLIAKAGMISLSILATDARLVAVYAVAEKLGSCMQAAYAPLGFLITPWMYRVGTRPEAPQLFSQLVSTLIILLGLALVPMVAFQREIVELVAGSAYVDAAPLLFPLGLAFGLSAIRPALRAGLAIGKKTIYMPLTAGASVVLGLPSTLLLTLVAGLPGAAWGTCGVAALACGLGLRISQRFLFVPIRWSVIAPTASAVFGCFAAVSIAPSGGVGLKALFAGASVGIILVIAAPLLRAFIARQQKTTCNLGEEANA